MHNRRHNSKMETLKENTSKTRKSNGKPLENYKIHIFIISFVIFTIGLYFSRSFSKPVEDTRFTVEDLKNEFPSQPEDIWDALEGVVEDVGKFHYPATFILLYNKSTEETSIMLAKGMAKYSLCILNYNCFSEPIMLNGYQLYREMGNRDYGILLKRYKPELVEKVVMITLDLHGLSGHLAQCFHTMCDAYQPLVKKTVYFFTIRLDVANDSSKSVDAHVEEFLRKNWEDISEDRFFPLYTRISNMIFTIVPENHQ